LSLNAPRNGITVPTATLITTTRKLEKKKETLDPPVGQQSITFYLHPGFGKGGGLSSKKTTCVRPSKYEGGMFQTKRKKSHRSDSLQKIKSSG